MQSGFLGPTERDQKKIAALPVGGETDAGAGPKTTKAGHEARQFERLS